MSKSHEVTAWIDLNIIDKPWGKSLTKEFDDKKAKYLIESMPIPNTITWLVNHSQLSITDLFYSLGLYPMLPIILMKNLLVNYYF